MLGTLVKESQNDNHFEYLGEVEERQHARARSLNQFRYKMPDQLHKRLLKLVNLTGLDACFIRKQVGELQVGT